MEFYRYDLRYNDVYGATVSLSTYYTVKETPKGYWIDSSKLNSLLPDYRLENLRLYCKWIPKNSRKRYAYPTKEEALKSLRIRTNRRMGYLQRDIGLCKAGLSIMSEGNLTKDYDRRLKIT